MTAQSTSYHVLCCAVSCCVVLQLLYMLQGHPVFQHHMHQQQLHLQPAQLEAAQTTFSTPQLKAGGTHYLHLMIYMVECQQSVHSMKLFSSALWPASLVARSSITVLAWGQAHRYQQQPLHPAQPDSLPVWLGVSVRLLWATPLIDQSGVEHTES